MPAAVLLIEQMFERILSPRTFARLLAAFHDQHGQHRAEENHDGSGDNKGCVHGPVGSNFRF